METNKESDIPLTYDKELADKNDEISRLKKENQQMQEAFQKMTELLSELEAFKQRYADLFDSSVKKINSKSVKDLLKKYSKIG